MDFHQTTDRYRKREAKSQMKFILWVISILVMLWVGWMIGQNQQWTIFSSSNERLQEVSQRNEQLEHMLAAMTVHLNDERNRRITAETLVDEEDQELLVEAYEEQVEHLEAPAGEPGLRCLIMEAFSRVRTVELARINLN